MGDFTNLSVNLDLNVANLPFPGLPPEVCDPLSQLQQAAVDAAEEVVGQIPPNPVLTEELKQTLIDDIAQRLVDEFKSQCQKPDARALEDDAAEILEELLVLPQFQALLNVLNGLPGGVNGVIGGITDNLPQVPSVPGGGGLPRAQLGSAFQTSGQIDPFGLAAKGFDPGVGTLLFQGVATSR